VRTEFYPFLNEQLKELVQQIEMYIQLLYQVLLFTPPDCDKKPPSDKKKNEEPSISQELKKRAYWLLYDFMRQKESVLKHLNLPKYNVPWLRVPVSRLHPENPKSLIRTFNNQKYHVISINP
jgi:hypothetical protein